MGAIANLAQDQADERALEIFVLSITDTAATVRAEAATALGKVAHQPSVPALIQLLDDHDSEVKKAAILALGKIGDRAALQPLQAKLADEQQTVRQVAALVISQLKS